MCPTPNGFRDKLFHCTVPTVHCTEEQHAMSSHELQSAWCWRRIFRKCIILCKLYQLCHWTINTGLETVSNISFVSTILNIQYVNIFIYLIVVSSMMRSVAQSIRNDEWKINRKRCKRERPWPNLRHFPTRGCVVSWDTMLQAGISRFRFPKRSLYFSFAIILPATQWPWGRLSL
jgi:hypothetical protein